MEVAISPVGDQLRPGTANTVLGSTGSSVFGVPTPPSASRPSTRGHDGTFSPHSASARGGRRLATLSGSPRLPHDAAAIVPVPRPGHTAGIPRQISSRGSSRGSARRPRLPGLGLSSSSSELRWLAKVTPNTAEDLVKLHLTRQKQLNVLATERRTREKRLGALNDEYMRTHQGVLLDQTTLGREKTRLNSLQLKLKKCTADYKASQKDTGKLNVMLKRAKKEWVRGMARMQDISQYANEQIQGLFRGSQWRMYNEMLREVAAFSLTNMHVESTELERERRVQIATRRDELNVLEELNTLLIEGREEANREREEKEQQLAENQVKTAEVKESKLTVSQLQRATHMMTKVERGLERMARRGHRFVEFGGPGHTVLDDLFDQLQHQKLLCVEASQAKKESAEKVAQLTAELEGLEKQLAHFAVPYETPEPDTDDTGNLSPRALGHEGSVRAIQAQQQQVQRQLNARSLLLPAMEERATEVIQWFKRLTPMFEPFDVYGRAHAEAVKAITPLGIKIAPDNQVACWLKATEATLTWLKTEVNRYRSELGRGDLDWQAFNAYGLAAVEEGKIVCVDRAVNLRVLTEEQESQRQREIRLNLIAESTKAEATAEKLDQYGGKPVSKADAKLEAIRAAAEEAELEQRIAEQIEHEERLDNMDQDTANAYSRERVRDIHDMHLEEQRKVEMDRLKAEKERRKRRRPV